jgi:hypothetical protein
MGSGMRLPRGGTVQAADLPQRWFAILAGLSFRVGFFTECLDEIGYGMLSFYLLGWQFQKWVTRTASPWGERVGWVGLFIPKGL